MMRHGLTGLDHPVIGVRDLAAARLAFERLGFIVPPRGRHPAWGTGNWCIQFPTDYLEVRGVLTATDASANRDLTAFLARRQGLMGVAFGTTAAVGSHASLAAAGLGPQPVRTLTREFELPEGSVPVSFELCFLPREATPALGHVVICGHLTPERLRRPEWLRHPNGACGVAGLVSCAPDPERVVAAWRRLFDRVEPVPGGWRATIGKQWLLLLDAGGILARIGADLAEVEDGPHLVSTVLHTSDPLATRRCLLAAGVPAAAAERLCVPPHLAGGSLLEFVPCPPA